MSSTSNNTQNTKNSNEKKLFIGGLNWETNVDSFREFFESICQGKILDVTMPVNHTTGNPRGFGFVGFSNKEDYDMILEMSKNKTLVILGKNVEAKPASNNPPKRNQNYRSRMQNHNNYHMQRNALMYGGFQQPSYYDYQMPQRNSRGSYGFPQAAYASQFGYDNSAYPQMQWTQNAAYQQAPPAQTTEPIYSSSNVSKVNAHGQYSNEQQFPQGVAHGGQYNASPAPTSYSPTTGPKTTAPSIYSAPPNGSYGPTSGNQNSSAKSFNPL